MRVVLDTSVIAADFQLRSASMQWLLDQAMRRELQVIVPELVVMEAVSVFRREVEKANAQISSARAKLRRLGAAGVDQRVPEVEAIKAFEERLRTTLTKSRVRIVPVPDPPHREVVERELSRTKPFDEQGRGYRDLLIWISVVAEAMHGQTVFISKNTKDFGQVGEDEVELDAALARDLEEAGVARDQVQLVAELSTFERTRTAPARQALEQLRSLLSKENVQLRLRDRILNLVVETPVLHGEITLLDGLVDVERPEVVGGMIGEIQAKDARTLDTERAIVELEADAELEIDYYLPKADAFGMEDHPDLNIVDGDWNEQYVRASSTRSARLEIEGVFVVTDQEFEDLALNYVNADLWSS